MLHPKVDGVWLRQIGRFSEVEYVEGFPGGDLSASWMMPAGTRHPALRTAASVEIFDGGVRVWRGVLDEPGEDGRFTAKGLSSLAYSVRSLGDFGNPSRIPDVGVQYAMNRGALPGWRRPFSLSAAVWGDANETTSLTVGALLDGWAASAGVRWGVDRDGTLFAYSGPSVVSWEVRPGAVGGGLTLADDDFATHLVGSYFDAAAGGLRTVSVGDDTAAARWGRREEQVDLLPMGQITASTAQAAVNGMFSLVGAQIGYSEGFEVSSAQITRGGMPAPLRMIRAGHKIRLHGVPDRTRPLAVVAYTDVVVGKITHRDDSQTVKIEPLGMAARNLGDVLKVEDESEDSGARTVAVSASTTINSPWITYNPATTVGSGTVVTSTLGRYKRIGSTIHFVVTVQNSAAGANRDLFIAHPPGVTAVTGVTAIVAGREDAVTGAMLQGVVRPTSTQVFTYNNNGPVVPNGVYRLSGTFEAA